MAFHTTEDSTLLTELLPSLKQRTDLDTLYTDATYGSPDGEIVLREQVLRDLSPSQREWA